jgi:hypothetical protein
MSCAWVRFDCVQVPATRGCRAPVMSLQVRRHCSRTHTNSNERCRSRAGWTGETHMRILPKPLLMTDRVSVALNYWEVSNNCLLTRTQTHSAHLPASMKHALRVLQRSISGQWLATAASVQHLQHLAAAATPTSLVSACWGCCKGYVCPCSDQQGACAVCAGGRCTLALPSSCCVWATSLSGAHQRSSNSPCTHCCT